MARGWESKSIEAQQEEAGRTERRRDGRTQKAELGPEERRKAERRRTLELAKTRVTDELARARAPAHCQMLEQALEAIEAQLRNL
jgi:hypothetical protein